MAMICLWLAKLPFLSLVLTMPPFRDHLQMRGKPCAPSTMCFNQLALQFLYSKVALLPCAPTPLRSNSLALRLPCVSTPLPSNHLALINLRSNHLALQSPCAPITLPCFRDHLLMRGKPCAPSCLRSNIFTHIILRIRLYALQIHFALVKLHSNQSALQSVITLRSNQLSLKSPCNPYILDSKYLPCAPITLCSLHLALHTY